MDSTRKDGILKICLSYIISLKNVMKDFMVTFVIVPKKLCNYSEDEMHDLCKCKYLESIENRKILVTRGQNNLQEGLFFPR